MRKAGMLIGIILWFVMAIRYITGSYSENEDVLSAFTSIEYSEIQGKVVGYGIYEGNPKDKEEFVKHILNSLGVNSPTVVNTDDCLISCEKKSDNAYTRVELVEKDGKNHVGIILDLKNNYAYTNTYKELIADVFSAENIDGRVNIYLQGSIKGSLNYEEKNYIAEKMIDMLEGEVVSEVRGSEIFSIYAYSKNIGEYIKTVGRKVNINVTASYDENTNNTIIRLATPINNLDY